MANSARRAHNDSNGGYQSDEVTGEGNMHDLKISKSKSIVSMRAIMKAGRECIEFSRRTGTENSWNYNWQNEMTGQNIKIKQYSDHNYNI